MALTSSSTNHLVALVTMMASGVLSALDAPGPPPSTSTATEKPLIIKAPDATCGYIEGEKGNSMPLNPSCSKNVVD